MTTKAAIIKKLKANSITQNAYNKIHVPTKNGKSTICVGGPEGYSVSELQAYLEKGAYIC